MKDTNLTRIKETVESILPGSRIILFGSRAKGDHDSRSDYDILVIAKQNLSIREKRQYAGQIMKLLAEIPLDVIVKTEDDVPVHLKRINSVIKEALEKGMAI